ncbi:hypothetical protein Pmani_026257 [Petrolisthes manimaculis]|uniref:Uncharacterized protein n=1 Tax=Petrolisthes manimaculis TaxID=1843537 RepID=A0AAE1P6E9_9EUCA|nr:hypothetical protein Pmani_026257 [Petrolisthes manimaculis]
MRDKERFSEPFNKRILQFICFTIFKCLLATRVRILTERQGQIGPGKNGREARQHGLMLALYSRKLNLRFRMMSFTFVSPELNRIKHYLGRDVGAREAD